jgi:hypothetical protein
VLGLTNLGPPPSFAVTQGTPATVKSITYVEGTAYPVAIAAALDHSGSLTTKPVAFMDMKTGFSTLFGGLRADDRGAVINFDDAVEKVQDWTTNKLALQTASTAPWDMGINTKLFDAAFLAVDEAGAQSGTDLRRAVIVATDGVDEGPTTPYSSHTQAQVTDNAIAKRVPIFTIGLGTDINKTVLSQMATSTGGLFFEAATSENLATIYQQLSTLLYGKQYVIRFTRVTGAAGTVSIGATPPAPVTSAPDTHPITACLP